MHHKPQIAFIDHYDSFSYNLIDWLAVDFNVQYVPYDDLVNRQKIISNPVPLVLSPGPRDPASVGLSIDLVTKLFGSVPIWGVCLGHQIIGVTRGHKIVRDPGPHHGSCRKVTVESGVRGFFETRQSFSVASYNSLVLDRQQAKSIEGFDLMAVDEFDMIQAGHWACPGGFGAFGVQFHPESFMSDDMSALRSHWLRAVTAFYRKNHSETDDPLSIPS